MADESPESPQRWAAKRRVALVVSILEGEMSVAAPRKYGLTVAEAEEWREAPPHQAFGYRGLQAFRAPGGLIQGSTTCLLHRKILSDLTGVVARRN